MQRKWMLIGAALVAALPAALVAQRTPRPPRPPREPRAYAFAYSDHHGRIGAGVNTQPDSQPDKIGAKLEGVSPGQPAAKAGPNGADSSTPSKGKSLSGPQAVAQA